MYPNFKKTRISLLIIFFKNTTHIDTDLCGMCSKTALSSKALATYIAMKGSVFSPFHLSIMVPQMLLEVGQLDEGSTTVWQVAFVRSFTWKRRPFQSGFEFSFKLLYFVVRWRQLQQMLAYFVKFEFLTFNRFFNEIQ